MSLGLCVGVCDCMTVDMVGSCMHLKCIVIKLKCCGHRQANKIYVASTTVGVINECFKSPPVCYQTLFIIAQ